MANIASAKKAHRASLKRRIFNVRRTKAMKDTLKEASKLISSKDVKKVEALLPTLYKAIDKAAKNHTINKNTAARIKSRIVKRIRAIAA
jgi:small subunit ribosomal protein S20